MSSLQYRLGRYLRRAGIACRVQYGVLHARQAVFCSGHYVTVWAALPEDWDAVIDFVEGK